MPLRRKIALATALALWVGGLILGFAALERYAARAGAIRTPDASSGRFLRQHQRSGRPLLVMAVHPRCPCTSASLDELGDLLARSHGTCDALILQYGPEQPSPSWPEPAPTRELGGVPVSVLLDREGRIAASIGAETSGHVVFVDATGTLRFQGGLTLARGHRGRTPAQDAILAALAGQSGPIPDAPVFGCALEPECRAPISQ